MDSLILIGALVTIVLIIWLYSSLFGGRRKDGPTTILDSSRAFVNEAVVSKTIQLKNDRILGEFEAHQEIAKIAGTDKPADILANMQELRALVSQF